MGGDSIKGDFTVKKGYALLCSNKELIDNWPWKLIWKTKLPPKVIYFCWLALYEACITQDNLSKRGIPTINRCYMCRMNLESVKHLFLHCLVAADIWNMFPSIFGIAWVMLSSIKDAYESWCSWKVGNPHQKDMVNGICLNLLVYME